MDALFEAFQQWKYNVYDKVVSGYIGILAGVLVGIVPLVLFKQISTDAFVVSCCILIAAIALIRTRNEKPYYTFHVICDHGIDSDECHRR